jgi:curved DNA-binding protein CbpA
MIELTPFPGQPVLQAVRELYISKEPARITVDHAGGRQMFRAAQGELQIRRDDPLTARLEAVPDHERPELLLQIMQRWSSPQVKVARGALEEDAAWAARCPASMVLLLAASDLRETRKMLDILGGESGRLEATTSEQEMMRVPGIEPQDAFVFTRLAGPIAVSEVVAQSGLSRQEALGRLCRLRAVGLIAPPVRSKAEAGGDSATPKLLSRIAENLEARPLRLMVGAHRDRVGWLLANFGSLDHYSLLGVAPGASDDAVHTAFVELARAVHPSHGARLELAGGGAALQLLFERAVEAYVTLCDPAKRVAYGSAFGITGVRSEISPAEREAEKIRQAKRSFDHASEMMLAEDYHFAVELLKQAVDLDPRAEYWALLAACQAKNANWLGQASESLRRALELKPNDPGYYSLLGKILEEWGDGPGAVDAYRAALAVMPSHPEALSGLERLAEAKKDAKREALEETGAGVIDRLRSLLKRS